MKRRRRTVKDVTYFEKINIVKRLQEMFIPKILDAVECMDFDVKCGEKIWSEICDPGMEYGECLNLLIERYSLFLKPEVRYRRLEALEYAERDYIAELRAQMIEAYGTDKISDLYKQDVVKVKQRVCDYVIDYTVDEYVYGHEECRDEYVDEVIDWDKLFIEQPKHILSLYMKDVYKCIDVYEIEMFKFRLHLENTENAVARFTEYFARTVGLEPATIPLVHLATARSFLWIVTLKNTELDDKVLVCERGEDIVPIFDPLERKPPEEIRKEAIILPLTHKFRHNIGVIAWNYKIDEVKVRGYYTLLY
jgi:hypothetical protein